MMVTVIIVNFYCHSLTVRAVSSVLADQPSAQVIVIDNSQSEIEAQSLRCHLPQQAELYISPENIGFGKACNLGYLHAKHDMIMLLNPDAFVLKGCIEELENFLVNTPQAGAVSPMTFWDANKNWILSPALFQSPLTEFLSAVSSRWTWLGQLVSIKNRKWALKCCFSNKPVRQKMLSGGLVLLSRTAISAAGGLFDPVFFMYYEDSDLCQRMTRSGFNLFLLPSAHAVHEWCASSDKNHLAVISRAVYMEKHFSGSFWCDLKRMLERFKSVSRPPNTVEQNGRIVSIPRRLSNGWIVELSPNPFFIPSFYVAGHGLELEISSELWSRFGPGRYWIRVGPRAGSMTKMQTFSKLVE